MQTVMQELVRHTSRRRVDGPIPLRWENCRRYRRNRRYRTRGLAQICGVGRESGDGGPKRIENCR